jgi:3-oxoacyl-[acyl-carrier-protein] synthase-1
MRQRLVGGPYPITAYSAGNALGASILELVAALESGRSGLAPCRFDIPFKTSTGALPDKLPALPRSLAEYDTRVSRIAHLAYDGVAVAVASAVRRHGRGRVATLVGTSTGGILETERALDHYAAHGSLPAGFDLHRQHAFDGLLEVVGRLAGARGPAWVVSTACSSSAKVLGSARRLLSTGMADAVLVCGADSLCNTTIRGFGSLQALSEHPCRPFCAQRNGTSIGEGAAFMLVEREGEGRARLLGVGESSDAHHMSHPHPEGQGAQAAMVEALAQAGLDSADVDHVNAHGTATVANDVIEAAAIQRVFGQGVPVASTKGYTGHLLGAAGLTEAVFAVVAIEHGLVPASLGAGPVDPDIHLDIVQATRRQRVRCVMSNSFAFGGSNAAVLFGAA